MRIHRRKLGERSLFTVILYNFLFLILLNTAVLGAVLISSHIISYRKYQGSLAQTNSSTEHQTHRQNMRTGLIRTTALYILIMGACTAFSTVVIYKKARKMQTCVAVFRQFFKRGKTPGNRINPDILDFAEAIEIAHMANGMMEEWERERKEYSDSEARYRGIVENVNTGIIEYTEEGDVLFCNRYAEKIFGYSSEELVGSSSIGKLNPEKDSTGLDHRILLKNIFANPEAYAYNENENWTKDGRKIWVAWRNRVITDSEGNKKSILCLANNITEQKKNRELLQKSLAEKSSLLQEIHHRINNNLQIIASILNLQKDYPGIGGEALSECENRVLAISLVHEQLFESENLATIDAEWYIKPLTQSIIESYRGDTQTIKTSIETDRVELDIDTAVPVGLIINELVTNAIQHGLKHHKSGHITVCLRYIDGIIHIRVHDNGEGLEEGYTLDKQAHLGLNLVTYLLEQLEGSLEYNSSCGTEWNVRFPFNRETEF